jgi:transcriptional repressor NF-X1
MYQENSTWAATQEKAFRLFAANPAEKRLRFKPMPSHQRAFLHSIAEDFGFDSESMDPEPHRHVAIFKTPRFVMAPMKTLAECSRIRQVQRVSAPASTTALPSRPKPSNVSGDPFNAFIITNPRFALTIDEVSAVVKSTLPKTDFPVEFEVHFLPSEEVALKVPLMTRVNMPEQDLQVRLESIKPVLAQAIASQQIGKLQLARLDPSLNILRRETDVGPGAGWSQVAAAKGAPVRRVEKATPLGNKGGFAVLSLSSIRKKKEKERQKEMAEVADDWEAAELEEEEKERVSEANSRASSARASMDVERKPVDGVAVGEGEVEITTKPSLMRWEDMDD